MVRQRNSHPEGMVIVGLRGRTGVRIDNRARDPGLAVDDIRGGDGAPDGDVPGSLGRLILRVLLLLLAVR